MVTIFFMTNKLKSIFLECILLLHQSYPLSLLCYPNYGAAGHRTISNWLTTICHAAGIPQEFGQPDLALGKDQGGPLGELL